MEDYVLYFVFFILSCVIGSFPTAYLVVKIFTGKDIRKEGTGNVGAMNTARATGKWYLFLLVAAVDALKGALPLALVYMMHNLSYNLLTALLVVSVGVVLGHCYSIYFKIKEGKFSGGKAMATLAGVMGMLDVMHLLIPGFIALLIPIALTGNLFLGQFVAAITLPIIAYFLAPKYFILTVLVVIPVLIKQSSRVIPMLQGKEPKWYWSKDKAKKKG